ncbi:MAG TPA: hypothetical protein VH437_06975 [Terriglobales bacterium]|jgi:hypothetical protein
MMPTTIETLQTVPRTRCTREQARELLESLRATYQALSVTERELAKGNLVRALRVQLSHEQE